MRYSECHIFTWWIVHVHEGQVAVFRPDPLTVLEAGTDQVARSRLHRHVRDVLAGRGLVAEN
jgi:hypothetical protein